MKKFFIIFTIFFIFSCGSQNIKNDSKIIEEKSSHLTNKEKKINIPKWFENPPSNTYDFVYGIGSGLSEKEALENAKSSIAGYIETEISSEYNSYLKSEEISETENITELIENSVNIAVKNVKLTNVEIIKNEVHQGNFYSLARYNKKAIRKELKDKIMPYLYLADNTFNAGEKIKHYVMAASFIPAFPYQFEIDNIPVLLFIQKRILEITDNMRSEVSVVKDEYSSKKPIIKIKIFSEDLIFSNIHMKFDNQVLMNNQEDFYVIDNFPSKDKSSVKCRFSYSDLSYPKYELNPDELKKAEQLVRILLNKELVVTVPKNKELKAWITVQLFYNSNPVMTQLSDEILSKLKKIVNREGITIAKNMQDANLNIIAELSSFHSSSNKFLGECYKSYGSIRIESIKKTKSVLDFSGEDIEEETKSFNKKENIARRGSLEKLVKIIEKNFSEELRTIKRDF